MNEGNKIPRHIIPSDQAIRHLCGAIRFKTVSNADESNVDWSQFEGLHAYLRESYPLIHRTLERETVGKGALLFTWHGKGTGRPYAFLAHMDVVAIANPENWEKDPFSGEYDGETIWGRGSADMKYQMIAILEAVETLILEGFTPAQDIYLCFGCNEEVMSKKPAAGMIAELLSSRGVHLAFVVDEAGAIMMETPFDTKRPAVMIGTAEKGMANISLDIRAPGGHSAEPDGESAMEKACRFVTFLKEHPCPCRLIPTVRAYVEALSGEMQEEERIRLLEDDGGIFKKMMTDKKCRAMVRTTVVPTILESGRITNAISPLAHMNLNVRILPGDQMTDILDKIRRDLAACGIEDYDLKVLSLNEPPEETPVTSEVFKALRDVYLSWCDDFIVAPYVVTGGTDSRYYAQVADEIYRISANLTYRGKGSGAHGDNEHVSAAAMGDCQNLIYQFIRKQSG